MKQRFSEEQIVRMLRQTEAGNQTVAEVCKEHGVSEQTWYRWKKKFGQMERTKGVRYIYRQGTSHLWLIWFFRASPTALRRRRRKEAVQGRRR